MAFMSFLRHAGAPVDRLLRQNKLPALCDEPDAYVPLLNVWSFFDTTARHEDQMVGWLAGAFVGDHSLNAGLLRKLEAKPTLFQALQGLARMARSEASDVHLGIYERREDVLFYTCYPDLSREPGYMISQAYQLNVILDLIRWFVGRHWAPPEIGIEDSSVPVIAEEHFHGSRILTQQQSGYIAIPRSYLHWGPRADLKVHGTGTTTTPSERLDYADTLRAVLRSYLPEGYPSERFAAELMDMSVRTLTRNLADRGLTYGSLIDELRFERAIVGLQNPDMRVMDVARAVGFKDQGDFTRMFRRIGGLTPREYRKTIRS